MLPLTALNGIIVCTDCCWGPWSSLYYYCHLTHFRLLSTSVHTFEIQIW